MTRQEVLDKAAACVLKDRNKSYGEPEDSFAAIAKMWTAYCQARGMKASFAPLDVACMMSLLKIARMAENPGYADGPVDLAGYAACAGECMMPVLTEKDIPATRRCVQGGGCTSC